MNLHYAKSEVEKSRDAASPKWSWPYRICEDWLELRAEVERLQALAVRCEAHQGEVTDKCVCCQAVEIERLRAECPIRVFCNTSSRNVLVARLASASDVSLFGPQYDHRITWNIDEAAEVAKGE